MDAESISDFEKKLGDAPGVYRAVRALGRLAAESPRARFYEAISRQTRAWSGERRGNRWYSADGLAMAFALAPEGALETAERPLAVETEGRHARGASIVDWRRESGQADNVRILLGYDQARFEALVEAALAAG